MTALLIRDEALSGETQQEFSLDFLTEHITVRELIRSRVYQEVRDFNVRKSRNGFCGLVTPTDAERTLKGVRLKHLQEINWQEQFEQAVAGFEQGRMLILINDQQAQSLEEQIEVRPDTIVTFVKLTLLVGG